MSTNDYCVDNSRLPLEESLFAEAYSWLREQAVKRGLTDNGRGIIWSWYKCYPDGLEVDFETMGEMIPKGEIRCCMILEVPDNQVLLIDRSNWVRRLNNARCYTSEEENNPEVYERLMDEFFDEPDKEKRQRIAEESWHDIFDFNPDITEDVEAIFFGLDKEMVMAVQEVVGTWEEE